MLFNSLQFVIFFAVVTPLYFSMRGKSRLYLLLAASCYFYMAFVPKYILILAAMILIDYAMGILIEKNEGRKRKLFLITSLAANVSILGFFKYWNFFNTNVTGALSFFGMNWPLHNLSILLPIGLSFHTFQSMSYTIEVYLGSQKAERSFLNFALYVMFYPQLVAGPIERPQHLLHQFNEEHKFDYARVAAGLSLMLWGFFKKLVIADRLGILVDHVFANPGQNPGWTLWLGAYSFAIQDYCDFSGYSDIAIGAAQVMGFTLMRNFDHPYFARSLSDYWNRWNISLSLWLRDYIYVPLAWRFARFNPRIAAAGAAFVTMAVSGLWHGANWTFVIWGLIHGIYLVVAILFAPVAERLWNWIGLSTESRFRKLWDITATFHLVTFDLILFRAKTFSDAVTYVKSMFRSFPQAEIDLGLSNYEIGVVATAFAVWFAVHYLEKNDRFSEYIAVKPKHMRWAAYTALFAGILLLGEFNQTRFIYFQF